MPDGITVTIVGLDEEIRRISKVQQILSYPDIDAGVKKVATIWDQNFMSEGRDVGRWRPLSPMTQRVRRERGYSPRHPILQQSGALRRVVVKALRYGTPASATGPGIRMDYRKTRFTATVTARGKKAENQYRQRNGRTRTPARPFYYVDSAVEAAFASGIEEKLRSALGRL